MLNIKDGDDDDRDDCDDNHNSDDNKEREQEDDNEESDDFDRNQRKLLPLHADVSEISSGFLTLGMHIHCSIIPFVSVFFPLIQFID